jgi:hypothetical protein
VRVCERDGEVAMHWKDSTSYQRDQPRVQTSWELELPRRSHLRVVVMSQHLYYPGQWAMFVPPFMREAQGCSDAQTLEDAQAQALTYARGQIAKLQQELDGALR